MQRRLTAKQPTHNINKMKAQDIAMMSVFARENDRFTIIKNFKENKDKPDDYSNMTNKVAI